MYLILGIIIAGITAFPDFANALEAEYIVYNGFTPLYNSFQKLALITSDTSFKSLYAVAIVVSIFISGALNAVNAMKQGKGSGIAWVLPLLAGIVVYSAMFSSSGTINLYDPVLNKTGVIPGVPDGIVAIVKVTNSIETGFVELISTSGIPGDYQRSAGGVGFNMAANAMNAPISNATATAAMSSYIKDCVLFEIARPGTTLSWNEILTSTDMWGTTLAKAQNYAIFTTNGLPGTISDDPPTATCNDSFTSLKLYYSNSANMADVKKKLCGQGGYDATADGLTKCSETFFNTTITGGTTGDTPEIFLAGAEVSRLFMDTLKSSSPTQAAALLTNKQQSGGVSAGFAMAAWIPHMKAVFTAAILALLPAIVIFIPTSICGRAMGLILGFFILIMVWGITDAVLNGIMMDYAVTYFPEHSKNMNYYLSFPDNSTAVMSMFGYMRSSSLALASMVTMQLAKFGGAQLASLGASLTGTLSTNANTAASMATHDKKGAYLNSMLSGTSGLANHQAHSAGDLMKAGAFQAMSGTQASLGNYDGAKGDATKMRHPAAIQTARNIASSDQTSMVLATEAGHMEQAAQLNKQAGLNSASPTGNGVDEAGKNAFRDAQKTSAGRTATDNLYQAAVANKWIDKDTTKQRFLEQMQSQGSFIGKNGEVMKMAVGEGGTVAGTVAFKNQAHGGSATERDIKDGKAIKTDIVTPGGSVTLGGDDKLTSAKIEGLSGSLSADQKVQYTEDTTQVYKNAIGLDKSGKVDWSKTIKDVISEKDVTALSDEQAAGITDVMAKEMAMTKSEKSAYQKKLSASIKADPIMVAGLATGGINGAIAARGIALALGQLGGVKTEMGADMAKSASTEGSSQNALKTSHGEELKKNLSKKMQNTSEHSSTAEKARKATFELSKKDSAGKDTAWKTGYTYTEGKGVSLKDNTDTAFLQSFAAANYSDIGAGGGNTAKENQIIKATNFLGNADNRDLATSSYNAYLSGRSGADPLVQEFRAKAGDGQALKEKFDTRMDKEGAFIGGQTEGLPASVGKALEAPALGASRSPVNTKLAQRFKLTNASIRGANDHMEGNKDNYTLLSSAPDPTEVGKPGGTNAKVLGTGLLGKSIAQLKTNFSEGTSNLTSGKYGEIAAKDATKGGEGFLEKYEPMKRPAVPGKEETDVQPMTVDSTAAPKYSINSGERPPRVDRSTSFSLISPKHSSFGGGSGRLDDVQPPKAPEAVQFVSDGPVAQAAAIQAEPAAVTPAQPSSAKSADQPPANLAAESPAKGSAEPATTPIVPAATPAASAAPKTVVAPVQASATTDPAVAPVKASATTEPVVAPVKASATAEPVVAPVKASATAEPVVAPVKAPATAEPIVAPVKASATTEPVVAPVKAPATAEPVVAPVKASATTEPVVAPVKAPATAEPVVAPVKASAATEPVVAPVKASGATEPVVAPVKAPATAEPVVAPVKASATDEPAAVAPVQAPDPARPEPVTAAASPAQAEPTFQSLAVEASQPGAPNAGFTALGQETEAAQPGTFGSFNPAAVVEQPTVPAQVVVEREVQSGGPSIFEVGATKNSAQVPVFTFNPSPGQGQQGAPNAGAQGPKGKIPQSKTFK